MDGSSCLVEAERKKTETKGMMKNTGRRWRKGISPPSRHSDPLDRTLIRDPSFISSLLVRLHSCPLQYDDEKTLISSRAQGDEIIYPSCPFSLCFLLKKIVFDMKYEPHSSPHPLGNSGSSGEERCHVQHIEIVRVSWPVPLGPFPRAYIADGKRQDTSRETPTGGNTQEGQREKENYFDKASLLASSINIASFPKLISRFFHHYFLLYAGKTISASSSNIPILAFASFDVEAVCCLERFGSRR